MRFPPRHVVVPMDFSEPSHTGLEAAKALAKRFGADLHLLYLPVFQDGLTAVAPDGAAIPTPAILENTPEFKAWRRAGLERAASGFPRSRIRVHTAFPGAPAAGLLGAARGRPDKWIVLATHGRAGLERALFGSVAEAVVRRAKVPVLTLHRRGPPLKLERMLIPYNMEPYARKALRYGVEMGRKLGARIGVLYVVEEGADVRGARDRVHSSLVSTLGVSQAAAVKLIVRKGDPRFAILSEAKKGKFGLIVLSAHRKPFWKDYVLGSTAERVLRHSEAPVLSVPSGKPAGRRSSRSSLAWVADKIY